MARNGPDGSRIDIACSVEPEYSYVKTINHDGISGKLSHTIARVHRVGVTEGYCVSFELPCSDCARTLTAKNFTLLRWYLHKPLDSWARYIGSFKREPFLKLKSMLSAYPASMITLCAHSGDDENVL